MMEVTFYDREQEMREVRAILRMKPRLITFICGPINPGKTEMINHLIEELPDNYVVFYINLRTKFLATCDDFIDRCLRWRWRLMGILPQKRVCYGFYSTVSQRVVIFIFRPLCVTRWFSKNPILKISKSLRGFGHRNAI